MSDEELTKMLRSSANRVVNYAADRIEQLTAERDRLRGAIEYVLDGYGLNGPDYRFQCGEEEADWITDHLIAALKGESHDR